MSCDVGKVTERLENEQSSQLQSQQSSFSNPSVTSPTSHLILQPFRCFTYVTTHSPTTLPSLYLRHNSFNNPSVALPTSQLILQPFFRFSYVTGSSLKSPGEPPMEIWIVRNKDEDKISGDSTVERTSHHCLFHKNEGRGSNNSSCARERVNTFSVSLQNLVSSCSSQTCSKCHTSPAKCQCVNSLLYWIFTSSTLCITMYFPLCWQHYGVTRG